MSNLTVSLLTQQRFAEFAVEWNGLLDRSASASFFLRWEWAHAYWKSLPAGNRRLLALLCHDGPRLVGIAPLYANCARRFGMNVERIGFLGDGVAGDYLDFIVEPGYDDACCSSLMAAVRAVSPGVGLMEFESVCEDAGVYRYAARPDRRRERFRIRERFLCPRISLPRTYAEFVQECSPRTRYDLRRKERRLSRDVDNVRTTNVPFGQGSDLLSTLFDLHKERWDSIRCRRSTFHSRPRMHFCRELHACLAEDDGYFSCLELDGEIASIVYVLCYKGNHYHYQSGWRPRYARYSPSLQNLQGAIRHAIDKGATTFDLLRGDEAYKFRLANQTRRTHTITVYGHGASGTLLLLLSTAWAWARAARRVGRSHGGPTADRRAKS